MSELEANFQLNTNSIEAGFTLSPAQSMDALFELHTTGAMWGLIGGTLSNQTDLQNALTGLQTNINSEATTRAENDTLLQNNINTVAGNLTAEETARASADTIITNNLNTHKNNKNNPHEVTKEQIGVTKTSDVTNDGDGTSPFATQSYVDTHGGKIDKIQKNGTDLPITNKTVNISVPTKTSDITNDSGYITKTVDNLTNYTKSSDLGDLALKDTVDYVTEVTNKPAIPTVNNATITLKQGDTTKGTFTLNQSSDETITLDVGGGSLVDDVKVNNVSVVTNKVANITMPTKISDLTDDTATNPVDKADTLTDLTATVTELNYVDGVTSSIQTQLNGKQASGNYAKTDAENTFTKGQVISRTDEGAILKLTSPAGNTNFILERQGGSQCVLESGSTVGLFGTKSNHPLQIRTNYANRMTIGTDGSVKLATAPDSASNDNQVATTKWVNDKGYQNSTQVNTAITGNIINNVTSTDTDKSLSANMGKELQDEISSIKARGRYLSTWNCTTGLAGTTPTTLPYQYKTGDYFIVSVVGTTNLKPNGSEYTGTASETTESGTVAVNDTYLYDGSNWTLLHGTDVSVTFSSIGGQPSDNTNLANALNAKANDNSVLHTTASAETVVSNSTNGYKTFNNSIKIGNPSSATYSTFTTENTGELKILANAKTSGMRFNSQVVEPLTDNMLYLGSSSKAWKGLFLKGGINKSGYSFSFPSKSGTFALTDDVQVIQVSTMPAPSTAYNNKIVQYVGTTTSDYTNGYFYKCNYSEIPASATIEATVGAERYENFVVDVDKMIAHYPTGADNYFKFEEAQGSMFAGEMVWRDYGMTPPYELPAGLMSSIYGIEYDNIGSVEQENDVLHYVVTPAIGSGSWTRVNVQPAGAEYSAGTGLNLTGTEFSVDTDTIQEKLTAGTNIDITNNTISATTKMFAITEDIVTVTKSEEYGVSPYSTSYKYTNIEINADAGIEWVEGALYTFIISSSMVVASAYRNVRVRIGSTGDWKPIMGSSSTIASGSTYFTKAYTTIYQYKTTYQANGGLHVQTDNNSTYEQLRNTVPTGAVQIDDAGYGARYSLMFPTTALNVTDERFSSLVSSSATASTKTALTNLTFYADRNPQYVYSASIPAGEASDNATYQYYTTFDLRYTANASSTYANSKDKVFLWLKDFNPSNMTFKADATVGNVFSLNKIATRFPSSTTGDVYIYFIGWSGTTWYTISPNITQENKIFKYTPSTGAMVEFKIDELGKKQDVLSAGNGIDIDDNEISVKTSTGISINNGVSVDDNVFRNIGTGTGAMVDHKCTASSANYATAIGNNAEASGANSIAIGGSINTASRAVASGSSAISIGESSNATQGYSVAIGQMSRATASSGIAMGYYTSASGANSIAIGSATLVDQQHITQATASGAVAIGYHSQAKASGAVQLGTGTNVDTNTLRFRSYQLLDASGFIPVFRLGTELEQGGEEFILTGSDQSDEGVWKTYDDVISKASTSTYGIVKVDGTTITSNEGVLSASATPPTYNATTETIEF